MSYANFVSEYDIQSRLVLDLARLLDDPQFAINSKDDKYGLADVRQDVFDKFCSACVGAGAPVPDLETALIDCHLPQDVSEKDARASTELAVALEDRVMIDTRGGTDVVRAIATIFTKFPNLHSYGSVDGKSLVAMANRCLIELGLEPIRPKYEPLTIDCPSPPRSLRVLIVDDDKGQILKTAASLAGWTGVEVSWIHQVSNLGYGASEEEKERATVDLAKAIVDQACDIILMDQGMRDIEGDEVAKKVIAKNARLVCVANTGGSEDKLKRAGCVASANKGDDMRRAMRIAFNYLP